MAILIGILKRGTVEEIRGRGGNYWGRMYRKYDNDINKVWNLEKRKEYTKAYE